MADLDLGRVIRAPGRLCLDPTDLSTAFPHGGTAVGYCRLLVLKPGFRYMVTTGYEYGGEKVNMRKIGADCALAGILRQWDKDAISFFAPGYSAGTVSQEAGIDYPSGTIGATVVASRKFMFSPLDPAVPAVLFRNAAPMIQDGAELAFGLGKDLEIPFVVYALRPSSGLAWSVRPIVDLTI